MSVVGVISTLFARTGLVVRAEMYGVLACCGFSLSVVQYGATHDRFDIKYFHVLLLVSTYYNSGRFSLNIM